MNGNWRWLIVIVVAGISCLVAWWLAGSRDDSDLDYAGRQEVLFWHFWGGDDREIVADIARRFNESQDRYYLRAVAMPGNNLDVKLFLAITGGDPPDLVNQDDPIVADWAARGAIVAWDRIVPEPQLDQLKGELFDSARALGTYRQQLFAVCNGLDIRALYYNQTLLTRHGLSPPRRIADLDKIAATVSPPGDAAARQTYAYLPDSRRLWAWGYVFGGRFFDEATGEVLCDAAPIRQAMDWMAQYSRWYGADAINAFRQGDQSLPGKRFPLLPASGEMVGRYGLVMDGQWRTRDIERFVEDRRRRGVPAPRFGVCPLPFPPTGRADAGWVNGNFFVVPRGAKCREGAWEFVKFWIGLENPDRAAGFCADGGWIPAFRTVANSTSFQAYLSERPLFAEFVRLAASPNQFPVPVIPGAPYFKRTIEQTAADIMRQPDQSKRLLEQARINIQRHLQINDTSD